MLNSIPVYDFLKFPDKQCAVKKMKETYVNRCRFHLQILRLISFYVQKDNPKQDYKGT